MLFLGRQLRTRFDLLQPCLEKKVIEHQASQKQHHDQHSRMIEFELGDSREILMVCKVVYHVFQSFVSRTRI